MGGGGGGGSGEMSIEEKNKIKALRYHIFTITYNCVKQRFSHTARFSLGKKTNHTNYLLTESHVFTGKY